MKILLCSYVFFPSVGGLETVSQILAREFTALGHTVKVITATSCLDQDNFSFEVVRNPSFRELCQYVHWCDVFFHNNISLKMALPLIFIRRPWVVATHVWITGDSFFARIKAKCKHFLLRYATCISVSKAIAKHLSVPSIVIPNPYNNKVFYPEKIAKTQDLIFVGRLVCDKGVDVLLQALAKLHKNGKDFELTIVGEGPEGKSLREISHKLGLKVHFLGIKKGEVLAKLLRTHKVLVVPSLWEEPFGVVALEAIACGCVVIGSQQGGLKEAIGPCGITFPNGNAETLTKIIADLFHMPQNMLKYQKQMPQHILSHIPQKIAKLYLEVLFLSLHK